MKRLNISSAPGAGLESLLALAQVQGEEPFGLWAKGVGTRAAGEDFLSPKLSQPELSVSKSFVGIKHLDKLCPFVLRTGFWEN